MHFPDLKKFPTFLLGALAAALALLYGFPVLLPFGLGLLVALAAEPLKKLLRRFFPEKTASVLGVSLTLAGLLTLLVMLTALLLRQLSGLGAIVPGVVSSMREGLNALEGSLQQLANRAPQELRPMLQRTMDGLFSDGGTLLDSLLERLPAAATAVLGYVADSFLAVGTACLSAFLFSSRLPKMRRWLHDLPADSPAGRTLPKLRSIRHALWGWLKAQGLLSLLCFLLLLTGFWILDIPNPALWAFLIALVDAVPLLGTGIVLIPWALVLFLQGSELQATGLLLLYGVTFLSRTILEPRLLGKQLGLDPLLTLLSLYAGYRFFGIAGMLLSPIICVVIKEAATQKEG